MKLGRLVCMAMAVVVAVAGFSAFDLAEDPEPASAAVGSDFNPGSIISDEIFYNSATMTTAQVQSFLQARVPTCRAGYTCLKDFRQNTTSQPARSEGCAAISGQAGETAASIIVRVSKACGINPRVMLVLLEKEQSLVTDTWPTSRQYRSATGYGCPDTADCDVNYYGFYNQVYHAAWQFKKYRARPNDRSYVAGRWNTILWHPNAACGSSSVYIQNQATAGLYLYTPYRPNAAALANLYGTGDGCSSYGNRNFWRIFTDWFGSTQTVRSAIVQAEGDSKVYLISGGAKHHITNQPDYIEFLGVLGPRQVVSKSYVDSMPTGRVATLFVRNPKTGEVALIQGGATHHFADCGLVRLWGSNCTDGYLDLDDGLFRKFKVGGAMTKFAIDPSGTSRMLESSTAHTLLGQAATAFNGGSKPFAAKMSSTLLARFTAGRTFAAPHSFIRSASSGQVVYVDGRSRSYVLRDWTYAPEYGLAKSALSVPDTVFNGYKRSGDVGIAVKCGTTMYLSANGKFVRVAKGDSGGLPVIGLDAETCRLLPKSTSVVGGPVFLKANERAPIYFVRSGKLRQVSSLEQLAAQNGGSRPTVVSIAETTLNRIPKGAAALDIGSFVQFPGESKVYFVNGWQLVHLPAWSLADEYRKPRVHASASAAQRDGYGTSAKPLGIFSQCGSSHVYAVTGGGRRQVSQLALAGNPFTKLHPAICATIPESGARVEGPLFVSAGSASRVAVAGGFEGISQNAMREANNGAAPAPLSILAGTLTTLPPRTSPKPVTGALLRASNSTSVVFVDGTVKRVLPNSGISIDLGISSRYAVVHPAEPALLATQAPPLSVFVQCGGRTYIASQGIGNPVAADVIAGFPVVALGSGACATLNLGGIEIGKDVYVRDVASGQVYRATGGKLVSLGATPPPTGVPVLPLEGKTIAGLPKA